MKTFCIDVDGGHGVKVNTSPDIPYPVLSGDRVSHVP